MTVSRCIVERWAGISTAITQRAEPASNSRRASRSTPAGRVRSPMPIEHAAVADDEHVAALELRRAAELVGPDGVRHVGEQRMVAVDRLVVDALAPPGGLGHDVDGHAVVDPRRRVAREQVVGQRREHEAVERRHLGAQRLAAERQLA